MWVFIIWNYMADSVITIFSQMIFQQILNFIEQTYKEDKMALKLCSPTHLSAEVLLPYWVLLPSGQLVQLTEPMSGRYEFCPQLWHESERKYPGSHPTVSYTENIITILKET